LRRSDENAAGRGQAERNGAAARHLKRDKAGGEIAISHADFGAGGETVLFDETKKVTRMVSHAGNVKWGGHGAGGNRGIHLGVESAPGTWDGIAVWIGSGVAEQRVEPVKHRIGDSVFEPLRLGVHRRPIHLEDV